MYVLDIYTIKLNQWALCSIFLMITHFVPLSFLHYFTAFLWLDYFNFKSANNSTVLVPFISQYSYIHSIYSVINVHISKGGQKRVFSAKLPILKAKNRKKTEILGLHIQLSCKCMIWSYHGIKSVGTLVNIKYKKPNFPSIFNIHRESIFVKKYNICRWIISNQHNYYEFIVLRTALLYLIAVFLIR